MIDTSASEADALGNVTKGTGISGEGPAAKPIDASRPQHATPAHDATAYNQAKTWQADPTYSDVRFNQDLVDTKGNAVPGYRPDVQGTRTLPDGTQVRDVKEVQSPSQSQEFMDQKTAQMRQALGDQAGNINSVKIQDGARRQQ